MSQPATEAPPQRGKPQAKKVGGLPTYAWALIAVGGVLVWYIWRQNSQAGAGNAAGTAANAFTQDLAANDALMLSESQYQNILAAIKNIQGPTTTDKDVDKDVTDKDKKPDDDDKKKPKDDDDSKKKKGGGDDSSTAPSTATASTPAAAGVSPTVVNVVGSGSLPSMNGGGSLPAMGDGSTPIPAAANPKVAATTVPRKRQRR